MCKLLQADSVKELVQWLQYVLDRNLGFKTLGQVAVQQAATGTAMQDKILSLDIPVLKFVPLTSADTVCTFQVIRVMFDDERQSFASANIERVLAT